MRQLNLLKIISCRRCGGRLVSKWHRHWKSGYSFTKGDDTLTDQDDIPCKGDTCDLSITSASGMTGFSMPSESSEVLESSTGSGINELQER